MKHNLISTKEITKVSGEDIRTTLISFDNYTIPDGYDIPILFGHSWYVTEKSIDKFGLKIILFIGILCEQENNTKFIEDKEKWIMNTVFLYGKTDK